MKVQGSNLYILIFPDRGVLKIGKADNVLNRIKSLRWIGEVDYESSYSLSTDDANVYRIEVGFRKFLHDYRVDIGDGDGKTEIYDISCIDKVLAHLAIDFNSKEIRKGISRSSLAKDSAKLVAKNRVSNDTRARFSKFYSERAAKQIAQTRALVNLFVDHHKKLSYEVIDDESENKTIRFDARHWPLIARRIKSTMKPLYPEQVSSIVQIMMFDENSLNFISELINNGEVAELKIRLPKRRTSEVYGDEYTMLIQKLNECWNPIQELPRISPCLERSLDRPELLSIAPSTSMDLAITNANT
ncbi:hypothetical protein [Arenicella xantha]|uniref:Uncharacterized protein n=1 Tax=Arenicella xantha TaxID=644221 RepID=A0A395JSK4_9GAMM|nr:hypothetical protein [Arenicella xantha]RBP53515.1 hypothetical protein DFR28_101902 [Arenicella xantha]